MEKESCHNGSTEWRNYSWISTQLLSYARLLPGSEEIDRCGTAFGIPPERFL